MEKQNKPNYWKIIGIFAILIIILYGLYLGFNYVKNNSYSQGYQDGQILVISSISNTGNIPYFINSTGNITIQSKNIKDICGNNGER